MRPRPRARAVKPSELYESGAFVVPCVVIPPDASRPTASSRGSRRVPAFPRDGSPAAPCVWSMARLGRHLHQKAKSRRGTTRPVEPRSRSRFGGSGATNPGVPGTRILLTGAPSSIHQRSSVKQTCGTPCWHCPSAHNGRSHAPSSHNGEAQAVVVVHRAPAGSFSAQTAGSDPLSQ